MKDLKLTIQEAQEMLLMSQSSVYSWIDKGKLKAVESPSGKLILISEVEANQIRDLNLKSKRNKTSKNSNSKVETENIPENEFLENSGIDSENYTKNTDKTLTERLISELKTLALEAGKYKQLEIIRNEDKETVKYWEEKFFEVNNELIKKNEELLSAKTKILELENKLKACENKGLFKNLFHKKS